MVELGRPLSVVMEEWSLPVQMLRDILSGLTLDRLDLAHPAGSVARGGCQRCIKCHRPSDLSDSSDLTFHIDCITYSQAVISITTI